MPTTVRTRFAPSPTGYLHVGGVRTALFAWLTARQAGGQFILRIEDTDQKREVQGSAVHIQETLRWLGLTWDEGPEAGGQHGPYFQSQRLDLYKSWADKLVASGRAYADPYTPEEVEAFRIQAKAAKKPFLYRDYRPENPPAWDGSQPLRFRSDPKAYDWHDAVMGQLHAGAEAIDDFVLIKSDGYPTYNLAHIIDDYDMAITHIFRAQEFIASVPRFLNLYEALDITPPIMATVPPIMAPDGRKKLSKRDGAKDTLEYRAEGYLADAFINFLASMGWNDGTEQEVFSRQELIDKFDMTRVQRAGALFDERRLLWLDGAHIRALPLDELYDMVASYWPPEASDADATYKRQVLSLVQERLKYFLELPALAGFFFADQPVDMQLIDGNKQLKKFSHPELVALLQQAQASLQDSDFSVPDLTERLNQLLEATGQKPAVLFGLIRVATTWAAASPGLADTLAVLGKDRSLRRIEESLHLLTISD